ncbi:MAG: alternative ribosome rescue aminoacyl-tRNA hydrolase ArfB [Desulfuromonadales bacterium]|nr:alternative ribosome rescue aminoacyl-tRNA hydrolase ArfB [Desulfuromonadales bacterium]
MTDSTTNLGSGLRISASVTVPAREIELTAIRSQGAGGQNVNKVSSGIHLRFDIRSSSLPEVYKNRLLALGDHRITADGVIVIKAQRYRSQDKNRDDSLIRLRELIRSVTAIRKSRRATTPTRSSQRQRLDGKKKRSHTKILRKKITE